MNTRMKNSLFYSNVSASAQPPQTSGPGVQENENLEIWSKNPLADLSQLLLLLLINHSSSSALIAEAPAVPEDHCYRLALYHCYSHKGTQIPSRMSVYHNDLGKRYEKELKLTYDQWHFGMPLEFLFFNFEFS